MNFRTKIEEFYSKYKRVIIATSFCFLAVLFIGVVALKTSNDTSVIEDNNVQTSAPSSLTFIMPVKNGQIIKDYSSTTLKYNSTLKQWESHKALDIKGDENADVLASSSGEVVSVENNYLTGTVIKIKHNNSLQTVYGSLNEDVSVKVGDKVSQGQVIGKIGTSAKNESSDGPHLHFEVLLDNVKVDPNLYLDSTNK